MRYRHTFSINFSITSKHEEADDVTADDMRESIQRRLDDLGDIELRHEAVGDPDTTEELPE